MDEFKEGMVVQLKSGGPPMTVVQVEPKYKASIFCQWFSGSKFEKKSFPPESLMIMKEEQEE